MTTLHKLLLALSLVLPPTVVLAAGDGSASTVEAPPGNTIVKITGDAAHGFEIHRYDGTELSPPTDSEARAECGEYDTRVRRVRCRTQVRTWYRDLAATQQALDWAYVLQHQEPESTAPPEQA
jgi:hypothetical protein